MAKRTSRYACQQCGATHSKWAGKCDNCGAWNSLVEENVSADKKAVVDRSSGKKLAAKPINEVSLDVSSKRTMTGLSEVDTVLGGGLMPGGVVLLAGQPGIGKSTLLLQIAAHVAGEKTGFVCQW